MSAREADIAVRITNRPPDYLIGKKVCSLRHALFKSKKFRKTKPTPIITWTIDNGVPEWALEHISEPEVAMRIDDLHSMYRSVEKWHRRR